MCNASKAQDAITDETIHISGHLPGQHLQLCGQENIPPADQ